MWQPGDVVVYGGRGLLSALIRMGSCSPYSHVGVVGEVTRISLIRGWGTHRWKISVDRELNWNDRLLVFESTSLVDKPCEITGKTINGVQTHEIGDLPTYPGLIWRLPLLKPLSPQESEALTKALLDRLGIEYDVPGVMLAATVFLKRWVLWSQDRSRLYCVELVGDALATALKERAPSMLETEAGQLSPVKLVQMLMSSGLYGPLERVL